MSPKYTFVEFRQLINENFELNHPARLNRVFSFQHKLLSNLSRSKFSKLTLKRQCNPFTFLYKLCLFGFTQIFAISFCVDDGDHHGIEWRWMNAYSISFSHYLFPFSTICMSTIRLFNYLHKFNSCYSPRGFQFEVAHTHNPTNICNSMAFNLLTKLRYQISES